MFFTYAERAHNILPRQDRTVHAGKHVGPESRLLLQSTPATQVDGPEIISLFKRSIIAANYPSVRKAEGWLGLKWVEPDNGNGPATMTFDFASTGYDSVRTHALETHQSS